MIELLIYLAYLADKLHKTLELIALLYLVVMGIHCFYISQRNTDRSDEDKFKYSLINFIKDNVKKILLVIFIYILTPSEKTIYMMASAHVGKEIVQSEISQKIVKILNSKLDEELNKIGK